jgi:hypothetical protein
MEELKRKDLLQMVDEYYKSVGRENPPQFKNYTNQELKATIKMFSIKK